MLVKFWGVRGSIPVPGESTVRYGGNTSCIEIRTTDSIIILDAGSGIRALGNYIMAHDFTGELNLHLILTHTHWDHVQGLPFFSPLFVKGINLTVYGPRSAEQGSLKRVVSGIMEYSYFPVKLSEVGANIKFVELEEEEFKIGKVKIKTIYLNHPIVTLGYRFEENGKVFVSFYDSELGIDSQKIKKGVVFKLLRTMVGDEGLHDINDFAKFCKGADLIVADSQYTKEEYLKKRGWGHSSVDDVLTLALMSRAKRVALFHHDPSRTDEEMDSILRYAQDITSKTPLEVIAAKEGMSVEL